MQKILDKNRAAFHTVRAKSEQIRTEYQNDLAGMVFCADCGRPMEFERLPHGAEHLDNFEFDIQLVKSLVQKIEVSADKRIRIVFGFRDVFTELGKESAET